MQSASASPQGTQSLRKRFASLDRNQFYREAQGLTMSSLGIGTYLGPMDDDTDRAYTSAVRTAIRQGINVVDTSLNYRHQHSERSVGRAIEAVIQSGDSTRSELIVSTKAGYLVPKAIPAEGLAPGDIVANMHCLKPVFLTDQLERSLHNLRLQRVDIFYLHNPETQLQFLPPREVYQRIGEAFATCEAMVAAGKISFYGVATWDGFRRRPGGDDGLQLARLAALAKKAGGAQHHFRFVQLPFNLAMPEAISVRNQGDDPNTSVPILEAAHALGISVISSATLMQGRLVKDLPEKFLEKFTDSLPTQAQRAIQFARSTPGITTALVGMSKAARVAENMAVGKVMPFSEAEYYSFYGR